MDLSALQHAAAGNDWRAIWPELALGCLALALLAVDIAWPRRAGTLVPNLALFGQVAILAAMACKAHSMAVGETFNGLLLLGRIAVAMRFFFVLSSVFVCLMARLYFAKPGGALRGGSLDRAGGKTGMSPVEFYSIVVVVAAALMLLAESNHLLMLFVALETVTVGFYILVSYNRASALTLEAGLKYLIMGALSSGLLLFGIVLLYGAAGNPLLPAHTASGMHYPDLARFLAANSRNFLAGLGIVFVLAGLAFKTGVFPFQIWIPDVYQGAPTPVTAYLAVASKAAGFAVLLGLVRGVFYAYDWLVVPVLSWMAAATIIFGNLAALTQHNVKRLIGLSGVSHAGFLLLGVVAAVAVPLAAGAVIFYLFTYLLASFAVFGVMAHLSGPNDAEQELEHYAGLSKEDPFLATVLAVGLGSLAGIPPLAGFVAKFLIFVAAFRSGHTVLLGVAITGVVISIYYYFGWIKAAFFESWQPAGETQSRPASSPPSLIARLTLGLIALASIGLGFYQGPLGRWLNW